MEKTRWYTITTIVDIDTGLIIPKKWLKEKKYRKINTEIKYEYTNGYNVRRITWECREHEQTRLFD